MKVRRALVAAGVLAFAAGVAEMTFPRLLPLPVDRTLVYLVGVLPLLQAYRVVQARRHGELREAMTPDPELPVETPPPGGDLQETLARITGSRQRYSGVSLRDELRSVAVDVLTRYANYSEDRAREALERGTWTDGPYAAAFLGGDDAPRPPFRARLATSLSGESSFERGVRETVDAIAAHAGVAEPPDGGSAFEPPWRRRAGTDERDPSATGGRRGGPSRDGGTTERSSMRRETGYWRGVSAIALVSVGVGVLFQAPAVVLSGIVGIGFGAYARYTAIPEVELSVDRTVSDDRPKPDDEVEVTVTVRNEGDRFLPDLRLVDGVPAALAVEDGSPRHGTALGPGGEASFSYTVAARRGHHEFSPTLVIARNLPNTGEHELSVPVATAVECVPPLRATTAPTPLRDRAARYAGQVATASGGEGIEFHATREYRAGDPLSRIDWNRRARTGEFATLEFREERAATVVLLIDARPVAYAAPSSYGVHAVDRAVDAAGRLFPALLDDGHRVGLAALGADGCWLPPGSGRGHRTRGRELLALHPSLAPVPASVYPNAGRFANRLRRRLPDGTQLVALSPLADGAVGRLARRFDATGYPVTVVTPDPTADGTTGQRLARVGRRLRITALRDAGIPVVDWPWDDSLDAALVRHAERGSR